MDRCKIRKSAYLLMLLLLTACAEVPKIDLGIGNPSDKRYKAFFADGRPQGMVSSGLRLRLADKDFTFSPLQPLYVELNGILDAERDKKELWVKEFNIYWMASKKSIPKGSPGLMIGGALGAIAQIAQDSRHDRQMLELPELESARCIFDASLRGETIHVDVSRPSCPGEQAVCLFSSLGGDPDHPTRDKNFREAAAEATHLCIKEVVNKIKEISEPKNISDGA